MVSAAGRPRTVDTVASSKRRPSKQKRNRQNRQERQARAARSAHAGEATAVSRGEREAVTSEASSKRTSGATGAKPKGMSARAQAAAERRANQLPGQRAVFLAFLFTVVSALTLLFAPVQVTREVDADDPVLQTVDADDQDAKDDGTVEYVESVKLLDEEGPAVAAGVIGVPIAITAAAVWFTKKPQRSNAWTMAMVGLAAYIFLFAGPYGIITLPAMIALAIGGFQSRRAENKVRLAELKAARAQREEGGEIIDVDAVEDEGDDADRN